MKANGKELIIDMSDMKKMNYGQLVDLYSAIHEDIPTNIHQSEKEARADIIIALTSGTKVVNELDTDITKVI